MSELERVLTEAQKAREEAAAAARRAAELEQQAEAARERAYQEQQERRRDWAERFVDRYDADITSADAAIQAAQERFEATAVTDLPGAVTAYIAWGEAAIRHYGLQVQAGIAAPILGMEATPAEFASPPPFSTAFDQAMVRHLAELAARARDEAAVAMDRALEESAPAAATPPPNQATHEVAGPA